MCFEKHLQHSEYRTKASVHTLWRIQTIQAASNTLDLFVYYKYINSVGLRNGYHNIYLAGSLFHICILVTLGTATFEQQAANKLLRFRLRGRSSLLGCLPSLNTLYMVKGSVYTVPQTEFTSKEWLHCSPYWMRLTNWVFLGLSFPTTGKASSVFINCDLVFPPT